MTTLNIRIVSQYNGFYAVHDSDDKLVGHIKWKYTYYATDAGYWVYTPKFKSYKPEDRPSVVKLSPEKCLKLIKQYRNR